jgi:molybdate transport system substrate-binding protein
MQAVLCRIVVLLVLLSACGTPTGSNQTQTNASNGSSGSANQQRSDLSVFAAASLTEAFQEIGKTFEAQHPDTKITFNFAGSPQLVQQITQGAAVDVFASASTRSMDTLIQAGHAVSETTRIFAHNRLVVIYPKDNPAKIQTLADLAKPDLQLVIAAKEVPVGQYALDFLAKARADSAFGSSYEEAVLKNIASYEQSVRAVLSKVALGEADAGIVYRSDITAGSDKVGVLDIPDTLNVIASYPIAVINNARHVERAQQFAELVLAAEGQTILGKHGFIAAKNNAGNP